LAEPVFRAAVAAEPDNAEAVANLGVALANLGRLDDAQRYLAQSLALDDRYAFAHLGLGVVLDRQGKTSSRSNITLRRLHVIPATCQAMVYLADAKMRVGLPEEALRLYQRRSSARRVRSPSVSVALANVKAGHYAKRARSSKPPADATRQSRDHQHPGASPGDGAGAVRARRRAARRVGEGPLRDDEESRRWETYAMALAETGRFDQASRLQSKSSRSPSAAVGADCRSCSETWLSTSGDSDARGLAADDPHSSRGSPAARLAKSR
jgi:tetratricopeptide (TPR) repeat protein